VHARVFDVVLRIVRVISVKIAEKTQAEEVGGGFLGEGFVSDGEDAAVGDVGAFFAFVPFVEVFVGCVEVSVF